MNAHPIVSHDRWIAARQALRHSLTCSQVAASSSQMLDLVPKGRDEAGIAHPMAWVHLRDGA